MNNFLDKLTSRAGEKFAFKIIVKYLLLIRYVIAGGLAFLINFLLLFVFKHFIGIWYLSAAVLSFTFAFIASFLLQKLWTFQDKSKESESKKLGLFLLIALFNLGVNTGLMYIFVDYAHLHYLLSQILTSALIAIYSFVMYKYLVFETIKKPQWKD